MQILSIFSILFPTHFEDHFLVSFWWILNAREEIEQSAQIGIFSVVWYEGHNLDTEKYFSLSMTNVNIDQERNISESEEEGYYITCPLRA